MLPETRYTKAGDVNIAYQVFGGGQLDLVVIPPWVTQLEHLWEEPRVERFLRRLASFARVMIFDRRGVGLSDPIFGPATLEEQVADVLAVMDAAGSERAALFAMQQSGAMAILFAAAHPARVSHLILYSSFARATRAPDYPLGWELGERGALLEQFYAGWGNPDRAVLRVRAFAPSLADDARFLDWWTRGERLSASPGTIERVFRLIGETDVRDVLAAIRVPTLVLHRSDDQFLDVAHSRYLAERIPEARLLELTGRDNLPMAGDSEAILGEVEEFVTGERREPQPDRVLATVLFTDIVGSTERAAALGDRRWRELLLRHDVLVREQLTRYQGREVKTIGDGFLATFDGPTRAVRCARAISGGVRDLGIEARAGVHTGECELLDGDIGGMAVHIAARVAALAGASEVMASSTVKDLVVGSGIEFADRGQHELKGAPGEWRLFVVASAES